MMENGRIFSAVAGILLLGITGDIVYKIITMKPLQSFLVETIVLFLAGLFYLFEATRKGIIDLVDNKKQKRKLVLKYFLNNTCFALLFVGIDIYTGGVKNNMDRLYVAIAAVAFIVVGLLIDIFVMKKSNKNVDDLINKK